MAFYGRDQKHRDSGKKRKRPGESGSRLAKNLTFSPKSAIGMVMTALARTRAICICGIIIG